MQFQSKQVVQGRDAGQAAAKVALFRCLHMRSNVGSSTTSSPAVAAGRPGELSEGRVSPKSSSARRPARSRPRARPGAQGSHVEGGAGVAVGGDGVAAMIRNRSAGACRPTRMKSGSSITPSLTAGTHQSRRGCCKHADWRTMYSPGVRVPARVWSWTGSDRDSVRTAKPGGGSRLLPLARAPAPVKPAPRPRSPSPAA